MGAEILNELPEILKNSASRFSFKNTIKGFIQNSKRKFELFRTRYFLRFTFVIGAKTEALQGAHLTLVFELVREEIPKYAILTTIEYNYVLFVLCMYLFVL